MIEIKDLKTNIENIISRAEKVIIVPHNNADFDAIGSALGLSLIAKKLKKRSFILVNDQLNLIDQGVRMIIEEAKKDFDIINRDRYMKISDLNDVFILTDVNKSYLVSISDVLKDPENIIIIDHHDTDNDTIASKNVYIDTSCSSASEIVVYLLNACRIKIPSQIANYLYAGIFLDTNKLTKNCKEKTLTAAAKLLRSGANVNRVNELFKEDYLSDRRVQRLIDSIERIKCEINLVAAPDDEEYTREEIAKAADYALSKYGADASFAIGRIENGIISVSGRSTGLINMDPIMKGLCDKGGGNEFSGSAKISDSTVSETVDSLKKVLAPTYVIDKDKK